MQDFSQDWAIFQFTSYYTLIVIFLIIDTLLMKMPK